MVYRVCVIVQLHPQFITKMDRTYCPSCYYREAVRDVGQELGVRFVRRFLPCSGVARVGRGDFKLMHDSIKPPVWSRRFVAKVV